MTMTSNLIDAAEAAVAAVKRAGFDDMQKRVEEIRESFSDRDALASILDTLSQGVRDQVSGARGYNDSVRAYHDGQAEYVQSILFAPWVRAILYQDAA